MELQIWGSSGDSPERRGTRLLSQQNEEPRVSQDLTLKKSRNFNLWGGLEKHRRADDCF